MQHVLVTGAAGLIGQNLIARLKTRADVKITAIDKHRENTATLRALHPDITVIEADLATPENGRRRSRASTCWCSTTRRSAG